MVYFVGLDEEKWI